MKSLPTTAVLLVTFIAAQLIGLVLVDYYAIDDTPYFIEPPEIENKSLSFIPILVAVFAGTALALFIARQGWFKLWKIWYGLSMAVALSSAFFPLYYTVGEWLGWQQWTIFVFGAFVIGVAIGKVLWTNTYFSIGTELFVYGGIVSIFIPILNLFAVWTLLIAISLYDMYAVWKSKHMVKLAEFQKDTGNFAGISLHKPKSTSKETGESAILGGGDLAFPLLFASTYLVEWQLQVYEAFIISLGAAGGLFALFLFSKQGKYYPAMPFITLGCVVGLAILYGLRSIHL